MFLGSQGTEWGQLLAGLKKAVLTFVAGFVFWLLVGLVLFLLFNEIPRRLHVFFALISLPWYVEGIASVLFVFLLPFHYGSQDG